MSQKARVLAALRSRGAEGITAADFAAGRVIDGQKPIMRVAGRIYDLKEDGHRIVVTGERDGGCYVYRLLQDAQDASPAPAEPYVDRDLTAWRDAPPAPRNAILGWDEEAA